MLDDYRTIIALGFGGALLAGGGALWANFYNSPEPAIIPPEKAALLAQIDTVEEATVVCHGVKEMAGSMRLNMHRPLGEILKDFDDIPEMLWIAYMLHDLSENYTEERDRQFMNDVEERCFRMFL